MKQVVTIVLALGASFSLYSCTTTSSGTDSTPAKPYPLKTCLVMEGVPLNQSGKPIRIVHQGQEMLFCCRRCVNIFKSDPEPYLAKLR